MWWLFLNDNQLDSLNIDYQESNDLVINKNIRTIPIDLVNIYDKKLAEYTKNKEHLKKTLKEELIDLINEFEHSGDIKRMMSIQIHLKHSENSNLIDVSCQTETQYDVIDLIDSCVSNDGYYIEHSCSVEEIDEEI